MPRVKGGIVTRRRHKKRLEMAKGYTGAKSKLFRTATEAVDRALKYAFRDRRAKKRDFRRLWIARVNAAARENGISYSRLIAALQKADVDLDRKVLAEMAVSDPAGFRQLVESVRPQAA